MKFSPKLRKIIETVIIFFAHLLYYPYVVRFFLFSKDKPRRLHVGCGKNYFTGWINADIDPRAELIIFLEKKLPFPDNSLDRIYSEHVMEHVHYETGVFFLKQAYRTLKPGGVIRIAMPDLDDLIDGYQKDWRRFDWVNWKEYAFIRTRAEMINIAFRWWGHEHLYNQEEFARALTDAGFSKFDFVGHSQSKHDDLRNLETRADSKLIAEAIKI